MYILKLYTGVATLQTSLKSADLIKIGLSSPRTRDSSMRFARSAISLCYCVLLGSLVEKLLFSLVALVLFCMGNLRHMFLLRYKEYFLTNILGNEHPVTEAW